VRRFDTVPRRPDNENYTTCDQKKKFYHVVRTYCFSTRVRHYEMQKMLDIFLNLFSQFQSQRALNIIEEIPRKCGEPDNQTRRK
jgi:hypothetical protein